MLGHGFVLSPVCVVGGGGQGIEAAMRETPTFEFGLYGWLSEAVVAVH